MDPKFSYLLSRDSDSSENDNYKHRRHKKKKKYRKRKKQDPIKLCAELIAKLLTTGYKSKVLQFKLDEDPLHRRIYFLVFIASLQMVFSHYKETYMVLVEYPTIEGDVIKDHVNKIGNIIHATIDVHSRR